MAVLRFPLLNEEGKSIWPEKFDEAEVQHRRESTTEIGFSQEYMLSPISLFGGELPLAWISLYDFDEAKRIGELKGEYFFGVDPSISGKGDYCSICVLLKSSTTENLYLIDFIRDKAKLERMIEMIQHAAAMYPPRTIAVEAVAAQQLLVDALRKDTALPVRSYNPKKRAKEDRLAMMANIYFSSGKVLVRGKRNLDEKKGGLMFDERMWAFKDEWMAFPKGQHDDTLDSACAAVDAATTSGLAADVSSDEVELEPEAAEEQVSEWRESWISRRILW